MDKLFKGIMQFRKEDYQKHKDLFEKLGRAQHPHTLFIGCSDSRVSPSLITNTDPGELFIVRNVANIVPPYRKTEEYVSTTAAIEYAVKVLKVENIVVCGHSNCGGCAALHMTAEQLVDIPHVRRWLEVSKEVKGRVDRLLTNPDDLHEREWLTEQVNILVQMRNLLTFPYIKERYEEGTLKIFGWHYIIETGEVYNFSDEKGEFEPIAAAKVK
ncbi:putative Carbonate dehydratase 1 [Bacteriovorax sp. BSW11_IV]|uniref:carbonic anhydrase n=1 Tax=Bacteriovorax sp. BSW11_IV TaxID=1353529 RepID=UPI00038A2EF0|nr:carbonic anhydrase [Bacteriovorax sp. BSW11_IV]EQC44086.1 putative Carbonate dehydratase 1 [Bacteriovorax sp. BSW11_IV]